jgi:hypothetical protein
MPCPLSGIWDALFGENDPLMVNGTWISAKPIVFPAGTIALPKSSQTKGFGLFVSLLSG